MEREAFARARSFLNFNPVAKWTALVAAVGTGLLYVVLLIVLGLYADLMVHRGQIASFEDLLPPDRNYAVHAWQQLKMEQRKEALLSLNSEGKTVLDEATAQRLATTDPNTLPLRDQERQWQAYVMQLLEDRVSPQAAQLFRDRAVGSGEEQAPANLGILSLVVSSQRQFFSPLVSWLARWNPWMWKYGESGRTYLLGLLGLAVAVALLRALLMFVMNYMAALATLEATTRLRRAIYHHTFRLGTLAFRAVGASEGASVFTRHAEAVHDGLHAWLTVVFREPVKFGLLLAFALAVNFWLALAFLLFALLVWLIGGQVVGYFQREARVATRHAANHMALLQESLVLMRLVKCYLMELFNQSRIERQLAEYTRAHLNRYRGEAIYPPLLVFLGTLAGVLLLFFAGFIVLNGRLAVPAAIVLVTALLSLYGPLDNWLRNRPTLRRGRESAAILFRFLDRPGEVGQAVGAEFLPPLNKLLEFDNVSLKESGTSRTLLHGITLNIRAGTRVAVVGPEDIEKHALVYLIPRFLDPTAGEIRIDQHNLRWVTLDSLRAQTAIVMQHNLVFNDTVANNIGCGDPSYTLPQIIEAAKVAHAHHFVQKLPQGYETPIGEMGHALRIGEQFRIALARAILRDPAILIIEEPPGSLLDDDTKAMLDDTFARILPGRTAIFLPHRISTIRSCNQIFLVHKGKIEAAGEHGELLQQNELYKHLYYMEFNMFAGEF